MSLLPIELGVNRSLVRKRDRAGSEAPVDPAAAKAAMLKADGNACRFCGFTAAKYQQVRFLNGDRGDWSPKNLATACIFCDQCFALDKIAPMRSGKLIWLPELTQAQLHDVARAIYIARISPGIMADASRSALEILLARSEDVVTRIGTDDPAVLAMALQDYLEDSDYKKRGPKLEGVRLMPLDKRIVREADIEFNQFPQILAYWRSKDGPYGKALPSSWEDSFKNLTAVAA